MVVCSQQIFQLANRCSIIFRLVSFGSLIKSDFVVDDHDTKYGRALAI